MVSDEHGTLWAIFEREGLARHDGKGWQLSGDQAFFHRFSKALSDRGGAGLEVGSDQGLLILEGDDWRAESANDKVPVSGIIIKTAYTKTLFGGPREWRAVNAEDLWFRERPEGSAAGPWQRYAGGHFKRFLFTDLVRTHDQGREELWVLSYGNGLVRLRDDGMRIWRAETGELPSEAIYSAIATYGASGDRTLWLSSRAGLLRIRDDDVRVFDRRHGLPSNAVRGIFVQKSAEGGEILWMATENGIARTALAPSQWQTVSLLGQNENGIFGLLLEPNEHGSERLWVGSAKEGFAVLEDGRWQQMSALNGRLPGSTVRNIWRLTGPDGKPWRILSLIGQPLLHLDDQLRATVLPTPWPQRSDGAATSAFSRHVDDQQELWFGTMHSGAYRLVGGRWQAFEIGKPRIESAVTGFAEQVDGQGRSWLWAASSLGIARFDGERFELLSKSIPILEGGFRGVALITEGLKQVLWASSNRSGVVRIDVTNAMQPTVLTDEGIPPPPDPTVYSVLQDSVGRIYICSNNGVQQLTPNKPTGFTSRVFRRRDGLIHDECNTNSQFIDSANRYWAGTLGGLSVFDPSIEISGSKTSPKSLHFTAVRFDGGQHVINTHQPLQIPNGTRELRIDYTLLTGLNEDGSMYRTQLAGYESSPGEWTIEHSRSFTDLAPGSYRLRVEARDYAGTVSPGGELAFEVKPLWWQRKITQALFASLVILCAFGLMVLYNRSLRLRQLALAQMVRARTGELNEANLRLTELSYLDPLTGLNNRRRLMEAIAAALERAREKSQPVGLIVLDVDHFKDYNDRHGHLAGDAALRAVAEALKTATRSQDLVTRFGGEEFACLLLDADCTTVMRIAHRMRALVEALPPRALGNDTHTITLSAGTLSRVPHENETAASLLHDADMALYQAKRRGRNRVCEFGDDAEAQYPAR